jgi:hypothetical protein
MDEADMVYLCRQLASRLQAERRRGAWQVAIAARELARRLEAYEQELARERAEMAR